MASLVQILFVTCSCLTALVAAENVTTIFQLQQTSTGEFGSSGTWSVVARGSARGLPLRRDQQGIGNVWAGQPCCESWTHTNWVKLNTNAASALKPPLSLETFGSANVPSGDESDRASKFEKDNNGVWRDIQCVAVVITGSSYDGKLLRFQTTRYGSQQSGSRRPTPNGSMKTSVQYRDDRVREGWMGDRTYNFHIERTSQGNLEVRLDGGEVSQKRTMSISANSSYSQLAVSLLSSDSSRRFDVTSEPAWYGELAPGESMQVDFTPPPSGSGHLGFAFCEDRFQERCTSIVVDGFSSGRVKVAKSPSFWTAGSEEAQLPMPQSSRDAKWSPVQRHRFSVTRAHDGTVNLDVSGDPRTYTYVYVPLNYQLLVIESFHNEGSMKVIARRETLSADIWQLTESQGVLRSPAIPEWFAQNDICVSIVARLGNGSAIAVSIQRVVDGEGKRVGLLRGSADHSQMIKTRLTLIGRSLVLENKKVQIVVEAQQPVGTSAPILIQWAAACDPDSGEDKITLNGVSPASSVTTSKGFETLETVEQQPLAPLNGSVCIHEGLLQMEEGRCLCRPGFAGKLCERGCGPNRFGEDCASRCSADSSARQCRGMWLCTAKFPCDCAPGLTGPRCDQVCEAGSYGVGCRQRCGHCAFDQACDPYTGWCTTGCKGGLQPPFCNDACGTAKNVASLIVHGTETAAEKYPWHAAIFDKEYKEVGARTNETKTWNICGGTILTPTIVVSAAHCFHNQKTPPQKQLASKYQIATGKTKRDWDADEEHNERVQRRNVLVIHTPEFYSGTVRSFEDDLAVLELDSPLTFTEYVSPICFDFTGSFEDPLTAGAVGRVAGWGNTDDGRPSEVLKEASLPFVPQIDCLKSVPFSFRPYAAARDKFCAGERGAYVDRGDSGGALVFADSRSGAWYLRGVVSVRPPDVVHFAAYTNVSYHRNYILDLIEQAQLRTAQNEYWGISFTNR